MLRQITRRTSLWRASFPRGLTYMMIARAAISGVFSGIYLPASVLYFSSVANVSADLIGIGITVNYSASLFMRFPAGLLTDRLGGHRIWLWGAIGRALMISLYITIHGPIPFFAVMVGEGAFDSFATMGRSLYYSEIFEQSVRPKGLGYMRAFSNLGMATGTGVAGLLLLAGTRLGSFLAIAFCISLAVAEIAVIAGRLPARKRRAALPQSKGKRRGSFRAVRDVHFVLMALFNGMLMSNGVVLTVTYPLWLLHERRIPSSFVGFGLLLNMILVTVFQMRITNSSSGIQNIEKTERRAGAALAAACLLMAMMGFPRSLAAIACALFGIVTLSYGELSATVSSWTMKYELSPADSGGQYIAVFGMVGQAVRILSPSLFSLVVLKFGVVGWIVLAIVFLASGLASSPIIRKRVEKFSAPGKFDDSLEGPASSA